MPRHHAIDYIEFQVEDLSASKAFFASAFGWSFNDYGPAYAGIQSPEGEGEVGGLAQREPGASPRSGGALVILFSEDLPASLAAVEAAGGRVTKAPFDFPGGRRFHFCEPGGNELAVWAEPSA